MAKKKIKGFTPGVDGYVLNFKKAPSLTEEEMGSMLPWAMEDEADHKKAQEWFEAFLELDVREFHENFEANPPSINVIFKTIAIAYSAQDPRWKVKLAEKKAKQLYGAARAAALEKWAKNLSLPKPKSKPTVADYLAGHLTDANGKPIKASTIKGWFPKKKVG